MKSEELLEDHRRTSTISEGLGDILKNVRYNVRVLMVYI